MNATFTGETFTDMHSKMHAEDTFEECTFEGTASRSNFYKAKFVDCVFQGDFQFKNCNLQQAVGVEDTPKVECLYITEDEWQNFIRVGKNSHLHLEE